MSTHDFETGSQDSIVLVGTVKPGKTLVEVGLHSECAQSSPVTYNGHAVTQSSAPSQLLHLPNQSISLVTDIGIAVIGFQIVQLREHGWHEHNLKCTDVLVLPRIH